jgi:hypothetical protein
MGQYARSKYKPFLQTFKFDLEIKAYKDYKDEADLIQKIADIAQDNDQGNNIVVIASANRSPIGGFYYNIKKASIENRVQTQIILKQNIENYISNLNDSQKGDFLWNFSFGIFSKLGGTPWKLDGVLEGIAGFIGLNTVAVSSEGGTVERKGIAALEVANSWGDPIGRFLSHDINRWVDKGTTYVDIAAVDNLVKRALDQIQRELADSAMSKEQDYVIVHVKDRYAVEVYAKIVDAFQSRGFKKFKIIHIQEQGPLRACAPEGYKSIWPQEGSYWYLQPDCIAFLYSIGRWHYSIDPTREPYIIGAHDVSPLQVNFVKGSEGSKLEDIDLKHLYYLTRLHYYSADLPRIKMPYTIRLGERGAQLAASGLASLDFPISFLY